MAAASDGGQNASLLAAKHCLGAESTAWACHSKRGHAPVTSRNDSHTQSSRHHHRAGTPPRSRPQLSPCRPCSPRLVPHLHLQRGAVHAGQGLQVLPWVLVSAGPPAGNSAGRQQAAWALHSSGRPRQTHHSPCTTAQRSGQRASATWQQGGHRRHAPLHLQAARQCQSPSLLGQQAVDTDRKTQQQSRAGVQRGVVHGPT